MTLHSRSDSSDGHAGVTGKIAVVTGASRGLGRGLAERFGALGMHLALCATTLPEAPQGCEDTALCRALDVTDPDAVERFASDVEARFGVIDLWVNNAGTLLPIGPHRDLDPGEVARALAVNIGGVDNGTRAFTRRVRTWPPARRALVNISSGASRSVYEGWSIYGATKAAVDHLTEIVAAEEPHLICRSVAPGVIDTDMQALIRAQDARTFPEVDRFREIERAQAWNSPAWIADHLLGLLDGSWDPDSVVCRIPDERARP